MSEPISIAASRIRAASGAELAYLTYGRKRREADPAVVLLHGFCGKLRLLGGDAAAS